MRGSLEIKGQGQRPHAAVASAAVSARGARRRIRFAAPLRCLEHWIVPIARRGCPPCPSIVDSLPSRSLVEEFGAWLKRQRVRVSAKSRLGEKLAYIGNHWDGLQVFLTDGRVEMDSNVVENTIRPLALNLQECAVRRP